MSSGVIPFLKMEGRSGCRLEVLSNQGVFSVKKFSKENAYDGRLLRQADKQHQFFNHHQTDTFKAPKVIAKSTLGETPAWFEMPYLHGQKYSEYFERASIHDIKKLAAKFIAYFRFNLSTAEVQQPNPEIFTLKLNDLKSLLDSPAHSQPVNHALSYLSEVPSAPIPIKPCHGDFTFSNMVFCEDGIYLVDFLDSFVESPVIDLVKFRQDTFFHWSLLIENSLQGGRASKIVQIFNHLDREVFGALQQDASVKVWYNYLQVFNLLRILPYVHHPNEIEFINQSLTRILPTS